MPLLPLLALPLLGRNSLLPISSLISRAPSLTARDVRVPSQGVALGARLFLYLAGENAIPALHSFLEDRMKVRFTVAPQLLSLSEAAGTWDLEICLRLLKSH